MAAFLKALGEAVWTALFGAFLTVATGALWSGLFLINLKVLPILPWAAAAMAAITVALWVLIGSGARARYRRANPLPPRTFALAVAAGGASTVALAGLWIVLVELTGVRGNAADFSTLPRTTLIVSVIMAALVGGIFEEAGFRGYFQGTLERHIPWPLAVSICALVMAPLHATTQGFVWGVLLFYLLVDITLGATAALTNSILPGIVVHTAGLVAFFAIIWPGDKNRPVIAGGAPDLWFWIHAAQTVVFGAIGIWLFVVLSRTRRRTLN